MWLDDLFPKAKFLDALAMVEKAGHKKRVVVARNELLNEGRPASPEREHPDAAGRDGPATPSRAGVPEDDLYGATPRDEGPRRPADEDDLDALIAEAEGVAPARGRSVDAGEEDDLDALIAEAESRESEVGLQKSAAHEHKSGVDGGDFAEEEEAMQEMDGLW
ncbi:hypothetical protein E4U42_007123 [Claviceps africana]|uniref:Chromosome segregation in meiosis protein 3 domain-containing protein n=1 Tax=Claviceps africana TaxID=83212 RepID=A0A8K0NFB0_9HYPO|nr:hypothetical protein E4U42_007123 [Claviceps africana]